MNTSVSKTVSLVAMVVAVLTTLVPLPAAAAPLAQEVSCAQEYTVQADDWLSNIADKDLGDPMVYPAIVAATNQKHETDDAFAQVTNPDLIEIGWKLCVSGAAEAAPATTEVQPLTDEALAELGAYIEENRELYNVPGAAVVVVQGGEVVYAQGFGVKEIGGDDPVTPDTIFSIGSLGKALTSMMVASLVDEGLIGWDTPIVEVMPQFQLSDEDATQQVTLRQALAHTTGLPNTDLVLFFSDLPPEAYVEFLADVPLDAPPGESRSYQNQMYATGAYVAAMAAGAGYGENLVESYTDLMQERVFDPIGMSGATFSVAEAEASTDHATPHHTSLNATLAETGFEVTPTHYWNVNALAPAGTAKASALDVGRFLMTMLAEGVAPDGTQVVSGENLAETWTEQSALTLDPFLEGAGDGLGWSVVSYQGVPIVTKDGGLGGFTAVMAFVPDADTGIVVLSNLDGIGMALNRSVQYRLVELLYGLDPIADDSYRGNLEGIVSLGELYSQLEPVDSEAVAPYLGDYDAPGNPHTIELRDGALWYSRGPLDSAQLLGSPEGGYVAISPGDFLLMPFQFVESDDGSIILVIAGALEASKIE
jgi:CubicO group peptidase (beta-lactamase class C family)